MFQRSGQSLGYAKVTGRHRNSGLFVSIGRIPACPGASRPFRNDARVREGLARLLGGPSMGSPQIQAEAIGL